MELKVVETILEMHKAQLLSDMQLSGVGTEILMNLNVELLVAGHS